MLNRTAEEQSNTYLPSPRGILPPHLAPEHTVHVLKRNARGLGHAVRRPQIRQKTRARKGQESAATYPTFKLD